MWDITMNGPSGVFMSTSSRIREMGAGVLGKLGFTTACTIRRSALDRFYFYLGVVIVNKKFKDLNEGDIFKLTYLDDVKYKKVKCLQFISQSFVSIEYVGIAVDDAKYYECIRPCDDLEVVIEPS